MVVIKLLSESLWNDRRERSATLWMNRYKSSRLTYERVGCKGGTKV
jgi:hypothetical protein